MKLFDTAVSLARHIDTERPIGCEMRPKMLTQLKDAIHPTCRYYEFIDALVCRVRPIDVIEIGTYVGTSAAHFAHHDYIRAGKEIHTGQIVTIDVNPDAKLRVDRLGYFNISAITSNSLAEPLLVQLGERPKVDVLFIDGLHNFAQAYTEYFYYRNFVREGGLILIDDAGLEMDGDEMNVLWEMISEPKERVDHLHPNVGFGIIERTATRVPDPADAIQQATPMIQARLAHA